MALPEEIVQTIRVIVADDSGRMLATSDYGGDISVVDFRYKFDDEDPDECTIKLQTSDPLAFDRISIDRSSRLQVAWGYIGGNMTNSAIVVVRDLETKYGRNQITTELVCSDLLFYLNTARSELVGELSMIQHLINEFGSKYRIVIKDGGKRIWSRDITDKKNDQEEAYDNSDMLPVDPFDIAAIISPLVATSQLVYTLYQGIKKGTLDYDGPGDWFVDSKDVVREWLEKPRGILQGNRSKMTVIRDIFKECPKGPWYITGRGQTLLIHNRDFINGPVRVYTYQNEPSQLMDFTAKTKYDQFEKNNLSHVYTDPVQRKFYFLDAYLDELFSMGTFKEAFEDKTMTKREFEDWLYKFISLMKAYETWHVTKVSFSIYNDKLNIDQKIRILDDKPSPNNQFPVVLNDNTKLPNIPPYIGAHEAVQRGFIYSRPLQFLDDRNNFIGNEIRKSEMEKEEAKIIVIGDPFLQSQMRVQVDNVHKQHKGLYYIKKCEHTLTSQGYKTTLDCLKVLSTNKVRFGSTSEKVTREGNEAKVEIDKQLAKEEELFGKPIRISSSYTERFFYPSVPSPLAYPEVRYEKVVNIQQEMDQEDFVKRVISIKFGNNAKLVEPNVENN